MKDFQYITSSHPAYIENLYNDYKKDPESIDMDMRKFFDGFDFAIESGSGTNNGKVANGEAIGTALPGNVDWMKEIRAYRMILGYRNKGHLLAKTNPIRKRKDRGANIELEFYGFTDADLNTIFNAGSFIGLGPTTLRNIQEYLEKVYANHVGIEFKYISDQKKVDFLTNAMEKGFNQPLDLQKRKRILEKLNEGVMFEKFLHTKYIGQKRFSLEGGETTIAALDAIINIAADNDVQEVVIGMAHRGRLNILANIMGKTYQQIFSEFEGTGTLDQTMGSGDVKYHLGYGSEVDTMNGKKIHCRHVVKQLPV